MKHLSQLVVLFAVLLVTLTACNREISVSTDGTSLSITVSESAINSAWRVTATRLRLDNIAVDLQPGQAVITATLTPVRGGSYPARVVASPTVSNGIVIWSLSSATVNGVAANADQLADLNETLLNSWNNYASAHYGARRVTAVTITDTDITYTLSR